MKGHQRDILRKARERFLLLVNPEKAQEEEKKRQEVKETGFPKLKKKKVGIID